MNNNAIRLDLGAELTTTDVMEKLSLILDVREMKMSMLQFKMTLEEATDEYLNSFYGAGYVFKSILRAGEAEKELFLKNGKLLVGIVDDIEFCWISFCGWYIIADGISTIRLVNSKYSDFTVNEEISANELYQRHFSNTNAFLS